MVSAPESLVHEMPDGYGWGIDFRNENDYPQTIVFEAKGWEKL